MNTIAIAFGTKPLDGEIFASEAGGKKGRAALKIDAADQRGDGFVLSLTPGVRSITSAYLVALLGASMKRAGSREAFLARCDLTRCQPWFVLAPWEQALVAAFGPVPGKVAAPRPAPGVAGAKAGAKK